MGSSLNGLQGSYQNLQNETKHSAELGKARKTEFSKRLADLTSELTKTETKEASLSKATKTSGGRTNRPSKNKSKSTRCSSRDRTTTGRSESCRLEDFMDAALPVASSKRRKQPKPNADDSPCVFSKSKDIESVAMSPSRQSETNSLNHQRPLRQRRASTDVLRRELSSKLPSRRRNSLTYGGGSRRRVDRHVSALQVQTSRPRHHEVATDEIESPGRAKSFDCPDNSDLDNTEPSGASAKANAVEGSDPFDTTGLSLVDKILIDDLLSDDSRIVLAAFCQLRAMSQITKNETVQETLRTGACSTLVGICRKWNSNTGILLEALRLFGLLFEDNANDRFSLMVVRMGGLRIVLSAMEKFPRSEPILEHACAVLRAMVSVKNKDPSISFVRDLEGLPVLLQTMKNHPSHVAINKQASLAFCSMARVGSLRKQMEGGGGMDLVQRVLNDQERALVNTERAKTSRRHETARGA